MNENNYIKVKSKSKCKWDAVALGEIMLRLDPGNMRVKTARSFSVCEGGGEYNVIRGLKKCFKMDTAIVTGIVENDIGYLLEDLINQGAVDTRYVKWFGFDGIGRGARVGINFTERGFGIRGALGVSDRANSAASKLKSDDFDWGAIFGKDGARWFHTGGIFAALSETTAETIITAAKAAKKFGTIISYDLNFRPSLWKSIGGVEKAKEINREIVKYVDVIIGNEEDFTAALGFEVKGLDNNISTIDTENFKRMINEVAKEFPNLKAAATTLRAVKSATINNWGAILYYKDNFYQSKNRENLEIFDRVGGGDSFVSGLIYGFLADMNPQEIIEYGAAHGALAMTTPGDTSMASLKEVGKLVKGGSARVER